MIDSPRAAWTFLTRVPIGAVHDDNAMRRAPMWFPLVGLVIGLIVGGVYAGGFWLLGPLPAAAVAIGVGAMLTGAFHHDGLADMADAFGGGWDIDQRLEIMKDSRHGTYGVMALVCATAIQIGALAQLDRVQGFAMLIAAHACARAGSVLLLYAMAPARPTGLGVDYARQFGRGGAVFAVVSAASVVALLLGVLAAIVVGAVGAAIALVALLAWRKIGGITGDVLGGAEQIAETAVLLCGAAFVRHATTWPWWRW